MKSVVATFLAGLLFLGSLVPQNDLGELAKKSRPAYYHFHHSPAGGCLTLAEFLVVHYRAGTKHHFGCTFSGQHQQDHQRFPLYGSPHGAKVALVVPATGRVAVPRPPRTWAARAYRPACHPGVVQRPSVVLLEPPRA